jgi:hypothetical protein
LIYHIIINLILKAIPVQAWIDPKGSRKLQLPGFSDNRHIKEVGLTAIRIGPLYAQGRSPTLIYIRG